VASTRLRNEGDLQPGRIARFLTIFSRDSASFAADGGAWALYGGVFAAGATPCPKLAPVSVRDWISLVTKLETRVKVKVHEGPEVTISGTPTSWNNC